MKFLGFEIRRVSKPEATPRERMEAACDEMNAAWKDSRIKGDNTRPWVIWDEHRMVLTKYNGRPEIVHE